MTRRARRSGLSTLALGVTLGFLGALLPIQVQAASYVKYHDGIVSKVSDGDTIHFTTGRGMSTDLTIRMVGMDTPETHFPVPGKGMTSQGKYGEMAAAYLAKLIPVGTHGRLMEFGKDKYGRTLGRVLVPQGDVNLQMVVSGMAVPYPLCTGPTCNDKFIDVQGVLYFAQGCETALKAGRGIFNRKDPLRELPYEFRRRMTGTPMNYYVGDLRTHALYNPLDYKKVPVCQRIFFVTVNDAARAGFR